jgi:hypothetical protein
MEPSGARWGIFVAAVFALLFVALYMVTHLVQIFGGFCC